MNGYWEAARYLQALLQERLRAAQGDDAQSGALTLEWIIIAVAVAAIAVFAVAVFVREVNSETAKLP